MHSNPTLLPLSLRHGHGVAHLSIAIANTAYTIVVVPYGAMTPVPKEDYDERTRLNGARMGRSMVGGIVAGVGVPLIAHAGFGSWRLAGLIMAAVAIPGLLIMLWVTRGKLLPTGWARLRTAKRHIRTASFELIGVLPEYRRSGLHAMMIERRAQLFSRHTPEPRAVQRGGGTACSGTGPRGRPSQSPATRR